MVARKIAAGEVIDRPNSVVRELLDNALDAGATRLDLSLENGGISRIRLVDNGIGMSREDLSLCCLPHATSKIETENDLMHIRSLGFRGEALSSIAASSRLDIISTRQGGTNRLTIREGKLTEPVPWRGEKGTIVEATDLFYSIPARRKFLKRPQSEGTLCRKTFLEKALPFPDIHFQLSMDGKVKMVLPPSSLKDRVAAAYGSAIPGGMLVQRQAVLEGFDITIVAGRPELNRNDRRYIQIFANKRRIDEYAFMQAVQYGYDEILPGGVFPVCFVFINVDPALVDFNIHPAKREARFRTGPQIHHELVSLIKDFLREFNTHMPEATLPGAHQMDLDGGTAAPSAPSGSPVPGEFPAAPRAVYKNRSSWTAPAAGSYAAAGGGSFSGGSAGSGGGRTSYPATSAAQTERFSRLVRETPPLRQEIAPPALESRTEGEESIRYMGQIMGVFLLAEVGTNLYIVDQHAAHEKILYERYKNDDPGVQELLIPLEFEVSGEESRFMEAQKSVFSELGVSFRKREESLYEITALPRAALSLENEIIDFLKCRKGSPAELQKNLYATMSCRNAIKEGDPIDPGAAMELLKGALALENPRCPPRQAALVPADPERTLQPGGAHRLADKLLQLGSARVGGILLQQGIHSLFRRILFPQG